MNRKNTGFTLVEILIVVIILGILAAIVIPQFTEASNDARESALSSDLQTVRSQIELYKVQHNMYPGYTRAADGTETYSADNFITQLINKTDVDGGVMGDGDDAADFPYGPYLQKFPANPFVSGSSTATTLAGKGWTFDEDSGKFAPSDSDHSSW